MKREFILYFEDMLQSMERIYRLWDLIVHEYFGIDYEMIWEIAKNNLPQNRIDLIEIIRKEKAQDGNKGS